MSRIVSFAIFPSMTFQAVACPITRAPSHSRPSSSRRCGGFFIVHIPQGDFFASEQMLSNGRKEEQTVRLKRIYEKLNIPHVDLFEEFPKRFPLRTIHEEFYARGPNGVTGHFSPRGNAEVVRIIADHLEARNLMKTADH